MSLSGKKQSKSWKWISFLASPMTVGVLITGAMTWLAVQFYSSQNYIEAVEEGSLIGIADQIHRKTIDFRLINRGEFYGSPRVAILAIDDASIEREGRWPWPREKIGRLIENAIDAGAKVVAFDVVFSESDQNSSYKTLSNLEYKINQAAAKNRTTLMPEISNLFKTEIQASNSDRKFAETIALYQDSVVMGSYFDFESYNVGERLNPLRDFCVDAHYKRTFEKKHWDKQRAGLITVDPFFNSENRPPDELIDRASAHHTLIEAGLASKWLEANPTAENAIAEALRQIEIDVPRQLIPILIVWANIGDLDSLHEFLQMDPSKKAFLNTPMMMQIFSIVLRTLDQRQLADLRRGFIDEMNKYCRRYLTEDDELLDRTKWAKSLDRETVEDEEWEQAGYEPAWMEFQKNKGVTSPVPLKEAIASWRSNALANSLKNYEKSWISVAEVAENTKNTGYFNAELDPDGTVRRSMLLARRGNEYIPSLALKTFLLDRGLKARFTFAADSRPPLPGKQRRKVVSSLEILEPAKNEKGEATVDKVRLRVPVDQAARLMINYSGPQKMFDYVSASSILNNDRDVLVSKRETDPNSGMRGETTKLIEKKAFLKDKILIVGATAIGVYDLRLAPFEENYPGVETHANILSNLLAEDMRAGSEASAATTQPGFLKIHPLEEQIMWMFLVVGGLLISGALTYLGSVAGLLATTFVLFAIYAVDRYLIFDSGYVMNVSIPTLTVFFLFVGITSYKYFTEERKKQALKGTFAKYVSPAVVEEILKDPSNIELGGKKMELTVMFSDVRGFTTISEKLDPRALSDLLNSYLTPMTDLVFETKGTLDKYMGDAIMAFWGAPVPFEDHPSRAATCALLMLKRLKVLQDEYVAKGLPTIDIGIGLNTGDMSVGNMGSNTVRSYTVMGDSVNLGSRLEGINKEYGTRIIVSEFTQRRIAEKFVTREVDWVRVKGKAQPVRIFELLGSKEPGAIQAESSMLAILPDFEKGFRLYHERKFDEAVIAFTSALNTKPDDECSQLYIERCQEYLRDVPSSDWDGVYTMKTK